MRGFGKLFWVETKVFLREPAAVFFSLGFPLVLLFMFGAIYGNERTPVFGGYGAVDASIPAYTALIIATNGILSMTNLLARYREAQVLRRLRCTPLGVPALLGAFVGVNLTMTAAGMALLYVAARLVYRTRFDGDLGNVALGFLLGGLSIMTFGFVLAGLMRSARSAQAVAMVLFYPMIFLTGATVPLEILPKAVLKFARFLPLTHVVILLRGLWVGDPWRQHLQQVVILAAILVVGTLVAVKTFRWE
jgi:ABC-2 type transport system permease protein